jgi:uncharacterized protein
MAIGVTIWHIPFFLMPQFGSSPIEATATVAVTFWYAWLFNHASGSSLLTLIATRRKAPSRRAPYGSPPLTRPG